MAQNHLVRVHLSNGRGGPRCRTLAIDVPLAATDAEVTCSRCREYLSRMNLTPGQISAMRRRGGKKSAKIPDCNVKFARIY